MIVDGRKIKQGSDGRNCSVHTSSVFTQELGIHNNEMKNATPISTYKWESLPMKTRKDKMAT